jgi:pimeloyl-ACP methyl ester carboxylesterase
MCLAKMSGGFHEASAPRVNLQIETDPRFLQALNVFPFPGANECFLVDTLRRVQQLSIPTLVLWCEEDKVDPPETARLLYSALRCRKDLVMLPGSGHFGHLDRQKEQVFERTACWAQANLP